LERRKSKCLAGAVDVKKIGKTFRHFCIFGAKIFFFPTEILRDRLKENVFTFSAVAFKKCFYFYLHVLNVGFNSRTQNTYVQMYIGNKVTRIEAYFFNCGL
jgi:hypothetical protein